MKKTLKCSLWIIIRMVLVALLSFMSFTLTAYISADILVPIFAVFYFLMLAYFFSFSLWFEGGKDCNRVETKSMKEMKYKGFLAAAIVVVPIIIINLIAIAMPAGTGAAVFESVKLEDNVYSLDFRYEGTHYLYNVDASTGEATRISASECEKDTDKKVSPADLYSDILYGNDISVENALLLDVTLDGNEYITRYFTDGAVVTYRSDASTGDKIAFESEESDLSLPEESPITLSAALKAAFTDAEIGTTAGWSVFSIFVLLTRLPVLYIYYLTLGNSVTVAICVCAAYAVCAACAGIWYILGYKKIDIKKSVKDFVKGQN